MALLNLSNFVIFKQLKIKAKLLTVIFNVFSHYLGNVA